MVIYMLIKIISAIVTFAFINLLVWIFVTRHDRNINKTKKQKELSKVIDLTGMEQFYITGFPLLGILIIGCIDFFWLRTIEWPYSFMEHLNESGLILISLMGILSFGTYKFIMCMSKRISTYEEPKTVNKRDKEKHMDERGTLIYNQYLHSCSAVIVIIVATLMILYLISRCDTFLQYAIKWAAILIGKFVWFDRIDINRQLISNVASRIVTLPMLIYWLIFIFGMITGIIERSISNNILSNAISGFTAGGFASVAFLGLLGLLLLIFKEKMPRKILSLYKVID
ncbi:hypothetical protein [Anaerocolumna xylanovorans]|uniref:Uncharacterized protein n=1 Tax=Anaerocolumna xylanovorans DSM 12503 TaxID=1121345 RepID=A0A1M7XYS9_9FIRM|nr:hypothetical protein [Anaerocolumna xylanovorans]SHO44012.1 hypothetical protein SAMN02745217_00434 [Anaerocolumna xylanovorans DSM 12503]